MSGATNGGTGTGLADADVLEALQRFATLPAWLADVTSPGRVAESLSRAVPELRDGRSALLDAVVDRLRAKDDGWHVHCRLRVVSGAEEREVVLVGFLVPPGEQAEPCTSDLPLGEPGWCCYLEDVRLRLEVEVADVALPALPGLVDPDAARDLLQRALLGAGHDVEVASCVPEIVRYKHGSRCTIVYSMSYAGPAGPDPLVVKTHQGDKGAVAWDAMRALWERPVASGEVVTLAEPLAHLPEQRVLVQGPVPEERTLKDLARQALGDEEPAVLEELRDALVRTAEALAALHRSGARYGRTASWHDELTEVREVVARLAVTLPQVAEAAEPLLARLEAVDGAVPADALVSAHHDFRPAQVLLHEGRIGFIDFDGACSAEPALDLGRFRGKLRDIGMSALAGSGRPPSGEAIEARLRLLDGLCDDFLLAYRGHAPVTPERVVLWEVTDLLTALLHTWTKVRVARVEPRLTVLRHMLRTADLGVGAGAA